jgi:hypothetical protein
MVFPRTLAYQPSLVPPGLASIYVDDVMGACSLRDVARVIGAAKAQMRGWWLGSQAVAEENDEHGRALNSIGFSRVDRMTCAVSVPASAT